MDSESWNRSSNGSKRSPRAALDPLVTHTTTSSTPGRLEAVHKALMTPFSHKKADSTKILSDLAPIIMTPRMMSSAASFSSRPRTSIDRSGASKFRLDFSTLGKAPIRLGLGTRRITSRDLQIVEATEELLDTEVPEPVGVASNVSLLRGFKATIPSADNSRTRRRQTRNVDTPKLGLKKLGMSARGLLAEEEHDIQSVGSDDDMVLIPGTDAIRRKSRRRGRESLSALKKLGKEELTRQAKEILLDKENLHVRRSLINNEIAEITHKIVALDSIRAKLGQDLLKLQEDELELDDEMEGVKERQELEQSSEQAKSATSPLHLPPSSRRRKGPAFLPSEHDELPPGVAFMTLDSHSSQITALDFSEPYGTLVSASLGESQPRVWDLFSATEIGRLRGHQGTVKCVQVEDHVCLTGGLDGNVRLWDLRRIDEGDWTEGEFISLSDVAEEDETAEELSEHSGGIRNGIDVEADQNNACARLLEGHTKAVTALYFEDECMVTGASDKTLRQWDLTTGQCVMTMDILWAISHSAATTSGRSSSNNIFPGVPIGNFALSTPPYGDGTRDLYEDFVGGVQFWGYGLVSGSGDGAVRMWDMRTGQAHRTLLGHTAPITCLQFDEFHIASGSLDKTIRIWDLRTGNTFDTIGYDYPVMGLQFDSRKIVAAAGENGIKVYNRTTMHQSTLLTNGHTNPVERLRYMDRYLVTGGRDSAIKIWSI